jgi:hypothetical protein
MEPMRESIEARLERLSMPEPNTGCLLYLGASDKRTGYGFIQHEGKLCNAHRVAYEVFIGPIPDGMCVLHRCDNPPCILADPDPLKSHLFLGTKADNSADMVAKGRSAGGTRHWSHLYPELRPRGARNGSIKHPERLKRGEDHPGVKLTEVDVISIRKRVAAGEVQLHIAREFNVTAALINAIVRRKLWRHVA